MKIVRRAKVRVPATTSNLGPGFDCLGLALGLYNEVTAELYDKRGPIEVVVEGEGAEKLPKDETNLIARAAKTLGGCDQRVVFRATNRIPLARGLGSSAAAAVAGLFAGDKLLNLKTPPDQLLRYAAVMEGHPDNAAPAALGGFVLSVKGARDFQTHSLPFHKDLCAVVCSPDFELATKEARAVLPPTVMREEAVENVSRVSLLVDALARGRWSDLGEAMRDRLHEPYRAKLVPGLHKVCDAARAAAPCGAALSGAGPSVLALCQKGKDADKIGRAMQAAFFTAGKKSVYFILPVDRKGVAVS
jgi:homoserine kinase